MVQCQLLALKGGELFGLGRIGADSALGALSRCMISAETKWAGYNNYDPPTAKLYCRPLRSDPVAFSDIWWKVWVDRVATV